MSRLIKDRRPVAEDPWHSLGADEPPPEPERAVIVPAERFEAERALWLARPGSLGVRIGPHCGLEPVLDVLDRLALIAIEFPTFRDGRGYSYARLLRERHRFQGELRAVGDVLRDQLFFMARCGFDAFELAPGQDVEAALAAFEDFPYTYQPAADGPATAWAR
ncbi:MAG: hypothetical protein KatS3mg121_0912 [Gammaproteobacteria bacterium]|nr:MAG: hypothetical protein KatS3mg121_0912 [Gammaproteobacteria bacterium]